MSVKLRYVVESLTVGLSEESRQLSEEDAWRSVGRKGTSWNLY